MIAAAIGIFVSQRNAHERVVQTLSDRANEARWEYDSFNDRESEIWSQSERFNRHISDFRNVTTTGSIGDIGLMSTKLEGVISALGHFDESVAKLQHINGIDITNKKRSIKALFEMYWHASDQFRDSAISLREAMRVARENQFYAYFGGDDGYRVAYRFGQESSAYVHAAQYMINNAADEVSFLKKRSDQAQSLYTKFSDESMSDWLFRLEKVPEPADSDKQITTY